MLAEPDVAMRIDQAGNDPAAVPDGFRAADRFAAQDPVGDPPLDDFAVGQPAAPNV